MVNVLVTGQPRIGKTTMIARILAESNKSAIGFITKEIREKGYRIGFDIETLSGIVKPLASKKGKTSKYKVGSYNVYVENVDFVVDYLKAKIESGTSYDLIVLDEVGKMELYSDSFKEFVLYCLKQKKVLGTIMMRDNDFTMQIKSRSDTRIFNLTEENRINIQR
ncbi:MAG: hypothetical protein KAS95_09050, partial [Candidatus Heimdallarchaeota archaeon]|nr:hypothetical protein [Candidatus Heimdallarchaeota archaeon]